MDILFLNFLAYFIWAVYTYRRYRHLNVYFLLILMISVIAFLGLFTVMNGIYYDTFLIKSSTKLKIEPYFYCFIFYFFPLRNIHIDSKSLDFLFNRNGRSFVNSWIIFYTFYTLLKLYETSSTLVFGLGNAYEARHIDGDVLFFYDNIFLDKILNGYGYFLYNASYPVLLLYAFGAYKQRKIGKLKANYLLFLSLAPSFLTGLNEGSRGSLFAAILCNAFLLTLYWAFISNKIKETIKRYSIIIFAAITAVTLIITIQRTSSSESGSSILRYFGESFPNLGYNMYDKVSIHPMGLRFFPEIVWGDNPPWVSTDDSYHYWENITGVPVINFKTFFGDLYIEFGLELAFIIIILMFLVMSFITYEKVRVVFVPILFYYLQMCSQSFAGFNKTGHLNVFQLEIVLLFSLLLYLIKLVAPSKKYVKIILNVRRK